MVKELSSLSLMASLPVGRTWLSVLLLLLLVGIKVAQSHQ